MQKERTKIPLHLFLVALMANLLASAAPNSLNEDLASTYADKVRSPLKLLATSLTSISVHRNRQLVEANPWVNCCLNCGAAYDYSTFWHDFDDLCTWAGNGLELWTSQIYYTGSYYCAPGADVCIHLEIQFLCGGVNGEAANVTYAGCIGYFDFVINPVHTCGGPPYPGAHIESADKCWIFQATADIAPPATAAKELLSSNCDPTGRLCSRPRSDATTPADAGPKHKFGSLEVSASA